MEKVHGKQEKDVVEEIERNGDEQSTARKKTYEVQKTGHCVRLFDVAGYVLVNFKGCESIQQGYV